MVIGGYRVGALLRQLWREIQDDNVLGLAAQSAYYFFFSLFPLLLFLTPLFGLVGRRERFVSFVLGQLDQSVPPAAMELIRGVVQSVVFTEGAPGLMSVGALLALWTGSNVFNALMGALNRAYDVEEGRPWWKARLVSIGMVLVAGLVIVLATVTFVAGEEIVTWLAGLVGLDARATQLWLVAQYAMAFLLIVGAAWLAYLVLPAIRQRRRVALVGALFASVMWVAVTLGFRLYVVNFGNYDATYGTIGAVMVLLTWMYLTMLVLLVGGELNSELHKGTASVRARHGRLFGERIAAGELPAVPSVRRVVRVDPYAGAAGLMPIVRRGRRKA